MKTELSRELELFAAALKLPETERDAYLQSACAGDEPLRQKVKALLHAHADASGFLESPASAPSTNEFAKGEDATRTAVSEEAGIVIGRYTLLQMIGEGGFGAVYMAEQKEPVRRRAALKIIKLGMDTKQVVARFEAERQALAMMDHPNIARVLDGGCTENGRPYFVMELVKGQTVTKFCDEHKLSTRQRLELFVPICQAIQHAHQKGIIHRDIKPSNILVATIDGRPVPKVIDFGIAKATQHDLTDKIVFTQFHQFMGTPAYMSPEQAAQDSTDIDTRSDIYSLGVLLYELLTGKTPVEAKELTRGGYDEIRRRIREIEPPRPSNRLTTLTNDELTAVAQSRAIQPAKLSKLIRGELDWVVLKAMDKDRSRRYETASAFAQDIRRYLDGEPVTAVKPSPIYHLQKFARRHTAALATAACFVLLLTVSACVSTAQAIKNKSLFTAAEESRLKEMGAKQRETELRRIAETERASAEVERDRSGRLLYGANMNLANRAADDANIGSTLEFLEMHRPKSGQLDLRNFEWHYLDRLSHSDLLTLKGHTNAVYGVAFSPDGKQLASGSKDQTVRVWDAASGQETLKLNGHTGEISGVAFSPDGKWLASASGTPLFKSPPGEVKLWNTTTGQEIRSLKGHSNGVSSLAFSRDGKRLASGSWDRTVKVWDTSSGQETLTLKGHNRGVTSVAFSPDGKRLASASRNPFYPQVPNELKLWDAITGKETLTLAGQTGAVYSVVFSPDSKWLASSGDDGTVKLWDITSGQMTLTLKGHKDAVYGIAFSPDGKLLASASYDQTVKVWDTVNGQETQTLKGHTAGVNDVAFSPDGKRLASGSDDQTVKVWDILGDQGKFVVSPRYFLRETANHCSVVFSPDGKRLATTFGVSGIPGRPNVVRVLDAATGQEMLTLKGFSNKVMSATFSADGTRLASACGGGPGEPTVKVWDANSGQELLALKGHTDWAYSVAFSPDEKRLVSASYDQTMKMWDTTTGREILTFKGHTGGVYRVTFSPDGKRLASASEDQTVKLWDAATGQEMLTLKGHTDEVSWVAFSRDGKRLASASWDRMVKVWDAQTGQELLTLKGHAYGVTSVAFSPDGKRLATASTDKAVKIWDAASGQEMITLKENSAFWSITFSPDGTRLASAMGNHTVKLWDATPRSPETTPAAKTP